MPIATIDPRSGERVAGFEPLTADGIETRLRAATEAFRGWSRRAVPERAAVVGRAAGLLEDDLDRLAALITLEMGKPIGAAREEILKCAAACRHYAAAAADYLADQEVAIEGERAWITYQPLGVVLAVMPWNFPFWQVIRFLAPALCAGNAGLLKHASNVPQCALALEELFRRAGAPPGVFQALLVGSDAVEALLADDRVAAATLTGSEGAGRSVAGHAGRNLKKTVLELGGSDPFIVMPSADLAAAATTAVRARAINTGQSCIAAKRFIVAESVHDDFLERFVSEMRALVVGDPFDEATRIGPLATEAIRDELHAQVEASIAAGGRALCGGRPVARPGWYYEPTVLVDVPRDAPGWREELFGPVAVVTRARDIDDAIALANDTRFGLGAAAWTTDAAEARRFALDIEAGTVVINGMVASDPRLPFGGVKASGYGRELADIGLREFVNIKTVRVRGVEV